MSLSKQLQRESRFLGKRVGWRFPFLAKTSCMEKEDRLNLAYVEIFITLGEYQLKKGDISDAEKKELKNFLEYLKNVVKPALEKIGFASWKRNELTDLSLRTSLGKKRGVDFDKIGDE